MSNRRFHLEEVGEVTLYKRRQSRNIRLTIAHDGAIRLSMPLWMPYRVGLEFVKQRVSWIAKNRPSVMPVFQGGRIGKSHTLVFRQNKSATKASVRILENQVMVRLPERMRYDHKDAQQAAERGAIKALQKEAEHLLPQRLKSLASQHDFTYKSLRVKRLKTRWGSCNQEKEIVLNCFLMQLPWHLIDYVILHELMHTRILAHGPKFWDELGNYVHDLASIRKTMRQQRPHLQA